MQKHTWYCLAACVAAAACFMYLNSASAAPTPELVIVSPSKLVLGEDNLVTLHGGMIKGRANPDSLVMRVVGGHGAHQIVSQKQHGNAISATALLSRDHLRTGEIGIYLASHMTGIQPTHKIIEIEFVPPGQN